MSTVLVYIEHRDGAISRGSLQLLTIARQIVSATSGEIVAAVFGHDVGEVAEEVAGMGVSRVLVADTPELGHYRAEPFRDCMCAAMDVSQANTVLLATTAMSRDFVPRVAARTGAVLATDCTGVEVDGENIRVRRSQYVGKCMGEFSLPADTVRMISIRPNTFLLEEGAGSGAKGELVPLDVSFDDTALSRTEFVEIVKGGEKQDVAEADIIVTGGRSLKSEENFAIIYELADALGGAVGATRAAVDAGYQPHARQIGLTGKMVAPRLYLACGVHGAIQHLAGMRSSRVIVAINTNPDAPIFEVAMYGCIADLFELVPLLTKELQGSGSG